MPRKKTNFGATAKTVLVGGVGGYVGTMVTNATEKALVKSNPNSIGMAPAVTAAIGLAGSIFTQPGTMVNDAANGAAIVALTELVGNQLDKVGGGSTTTPTTTEPATVQGNRRLNANITNPNAFMRMNSYDVTSNPYMY